MGRLAPALIFPAELRRGARSLPLEAQLITLRGVGLYQRYLTCSLIPAALSLVALALIAGVHMAIISVTLILIPPVQISLAFWNRPQGQQESLALLAEFNQMHRFGFGGVLIMMVLPMIMAGLLMQVPYPALQGIVTGTALASSITGRIALKFLISILKDEPGLPRTTRRFLRQSREVRA